jgi:hypothetical protein
VWCVWVMNGREWTFLSMLCTQVWAHTSQQHVFLYVLRACAVEHTRDGGRMRMVALD